MNKRALDLYDVRYLKEVQNELKKRFSLRDEDADRYIQESTFIKFLYDDPEHVHHEEPTTWVQLIARQQHLKRTKPL